MGGIPLEKPLWSRHGSRWGVRVPSCPPHATGVRGFGPGAGCGTAPLCPGTHSSGARGWGGEAHPGRARPRPAGTGGSSPGRRAASSGPGREPRTLARGPACQWASPPLPAEKQRLPRWRLPGKERRGALPSPWGEQGRLQPKVKVARREALLAGTEAGGRARSGGGAEGRRRGESTALCGGGSPLGRLSSARGLGRGEGVGSSVL